MYRNIKYIRKHNIKSCYFKVMPRVREPVTDAEIKFIISLPASPGDRIRGPVPARAAPAEVTAPR